MANRVALDIPNPDGTDTVVYTSINIQKAPDVAGAPGAFSALATIPIVTSEERTTTYVDAAGTLTSWYIHQYTDGTTNSDFSAARQAGDYTVRQWISADMADPIDTITNAQWDQWRDMTIQDMRFAGIGRPAAIQSFKATSSTNEWVTLNADIRDVTNVDVYAGTYFVYSLGNPGQRGRQLRIPFPDTTATYKIYGRGEIRGLYDMDDELFMLLYWGMKLKYIDFRLHERMNFKSRMSKTTKDDMTITTLLQIKADAKREYTERLNLAKTSETMTLETL